MTENARGFGSSERTGYSHWKKEPNASRVPPVPQSMPKIFVFGHPDDPPYLMKSKKGRKTASLNVTAVAFFVTNFAFFGQKVSPEGRKWSFFVHKWEVKSRVRSFFVLYCT
jgi:hypothetical protein